MSAHVMDQIEAAIGRRPERLSRMGGGCVGDVALAEFGDGERLVVKSASGAGATLDIEGRMLKDLARVGVIPVPRVVFASATLLVMEHVRGSSGWGAEAERHAAELLARLHGVTGEGYGFEYDTLIGGLHQANPKGDDWVGFFREHRLLAMAREAQRAGRLPGELMGRVERMAGMLDGLLEAPEAPSLLHGDVWSGNVLAEGGRVTGFLDPAIYRGHPEIELAFITMFGTFGEAFFARYREIRGIADGFFEARRDIYNLYPLLVHVRLFGGGYVSSVERTLRRFGA
ncbi:MAG: fructosamine kinase family protein [Planctomycetota bacterium]|nr:fructosamine kinase family protein [Planctomycetota bacterium]